MMNSSSKPLFPFFFFFLVLFLLGQMGLQVGAYHPTKLFVFGDSYVDAGNTNQDGPGAWKGPYGMTWPGKPAGRFSDGRVFSDFIAKYLGLKSPVPYELRKNVSSEELKNGMNFAVGGTGVFEFESPPNMTTQIDFFERLIKEKVYNASDLNNSVAYVSVAGNDYNHYLATINVSISDIIKDLQDLQGFIDYVVNQTTINLIRIHKLGVKKVAVGLIQPLGCLPFITTKLPLHVCSNLINLILKYHHNAPLKKNVATLNQQTKSNYSAFVTVDLFDSFKSVIDHPKDYNITEPLTPCCVGVGKGNNCGSVDDNNVKKFTVCDNTGSTFFWDTFHPTQAGWRAVYSKLQAMDGLGQLRH